MFSDLLKLGVVVETLDDEADVVKTITYKDVYCNLKGVRQSEFYQAASQGLKAEKMFIIQKSDYNDEELVQYSGKHYKIIRTYPVKTNEDLMEIICEGMVIDG